MNKSIQPSASKVISQGSVVRIHDHEAGKKKWLIILGIDDGYVMAGAVRINSKENLNIFRTEELRSFLYPISQKNNPFLKRDSFVDCLTLVEFYYQKLCANIKNNPEEYLGEITSEDFDAITSILSTSEAISVNQLKRYNIGQL